MPYKANEPRRHKIPRARYKVTNWPEYDRALQQRGDLTVFSDWSCRGQAAFFLIGPIGRYRIMSAALDQATRAQVS